jgi:hypothetical protein
MDVWLNGKQLAGEPAGANLLEIISAMLPSGGREEAVGEVRVNGAPFEAALMGPAQELDRGRIRSLEVDTISNRRMAQHFLANAGHFLQTMSSTLEQVAEMFRVADEREASEHYLRLLESLHLFLQVLELSRQELGLELESVQAGGVSAAVRLERLSGLVQEMLSAQQTEDWVLLADLLQYDLMAELAAWRRIMPLLAQRASS